jgi:PAS domain S-box-containing protein
MDRDTANERLRERLTKACKRIAELEDILQTSILKSQSGLDSGNEIARALLSTSLQSIYVIDKHGIVLGARISGARRLGHDPHEMIGHCLFDLLPPDSAHRQRAFVREVFQTGKLVRFEDQNQNTWLDIALYPISDGTGQTAKLLIRVDDITDRKRAEEEFSVSSKRLARAELISRSGNWEFDLESNRVFASEGARRIYGLPNHEWTISEVQQIPLQEYRNILDRALMELIQENRPYDVEFKIERLDTGEIVDIRSVAEYDRHRHVVFGIIQDITERKRAEEALKESEERYRIAIESSNDGITIAKGNQYIYVNRRFLEMFGYDSLEEVLERPTFVSVHPDDREMVMNINRRRQKGEPVPGKYEFKGIRKDRTILYVEVSATTTTYQGEKVTLAFLRDITERKQAEQRIVESERLLQGILAASPVGIITYKSSGQCVSVNDEVVNIVGGSRDELLAQNFRHLKSWKDSGMLDAAKRTLETGEARTLETRVLSTFGRDRWFSCSFSPFQHAGELHLLLAISDISERKHAEEALRESEKKFRDIAEMMPQMIYEIDRDGRLIFANEEAFRILGITEQEHRDELNAFDLFPPDEHPKLRRNMEKVSRGDLSSGNEYTMLGRDGTRIPVIAYSIPIFRDGKQAGFRGIIIDITERKQAKEALRWKTALLEAQINTSVDGVLVVDENNRRIIANRRLIDLWGTPQHILDDEDGTALLNYVAILVKYPKEFLQKVMYLYDHPYETSRDEIEFKNGMVLDRYSAPVVGVDSHHYGRIWIFRDITERRRAEEETLRSREELRSLADHLTTILEDEKAKLARELHDELGQSLTAALFQLGWLRKKLRRDQKPLADKVDALAVLTNEAIKTTKRIQGELRPLMLDDLGLYATMEWQARSFTEHTDIPIHLDGNLERVADQGISVALFRIFQEALTNVARHAGATLIGVQLLEDENEVTLSISDNGRGIKDNEMHKPFSFGLLGMKERVKALGGTITIQGIPGEGTTLRVRMPLGTIRKG